MSIIIFLLTCIFANQQYIQSYMQPELLVSNTLFVSIHHCLNQNKMSLQAKKAATLMKGKGNGYFTPSIVL